MDKLIFLAMVLVSLAGTVPARAQELAADSVSDLWLDISLGPPLVSWFNEVARPNDIARIENVSQIGMLSEVTAGRKLVIFKSVTETEAVLPAIADRFDIIGYNLEQGNLNADADKADPVGSAIRMRELADQYGLQLAFGPDHDFALSSGVAVAPYVDIFVLQVQRVQTDPQRVYDFVLPLVPQLRAANPDLQISVQVRTEGNVQAIGNLVEGMIANLNGVSILTSPETTIVAKEMVMEFRSRSGDVVEEDGRQNGRPPTLSISSPESGSGSGGAGIPSGALFIAVMGMFVGLFLALLRLRR